MMRVTRRNLASLGDFQARASKYWTADRVHHLSERPLPLSPEVSGVPALLRVLGLMNSDGTISAADMRKYRQLNAMLEAVERTIFSDAVLGTSPALTTSEGMPPLRFVDLGTGASSHMALLLAFASDQLWQRRARILAVDASEKRVERARQRAEMLGFSSDTLQYSVSAIRDLPSWSDLCASAFPLDRVSKPPHGVFALHACDTATDEAAAFAIRSGAKAILLAPCCQAELAGAWKRANHVAQQHTSSAPSSGMSSHPFSAVHRLPSLRTEMGATITDTLRVLLLQASGYSTTATDFVATEHTPKNRLITAIRQRPDPGTGRLPASAERARHVGLAEYRKLRDATGGHGIALARMLGVE